MPIILAQVDAPPSVARAPDAAAAVTHPDWVRQPGGAELERYYPVEQKRQLLVGNAGISCSIAADGTLEGCASWVRDGDAAEFGVAALKVVKYFQMKPIDIEGRPVVGRKVNIPIGFRLPAVRAPDVVVNQPSLPEGLVDVDCRAMPKSVVDNCRVLSVRPENQQMVDLANQLIAHFRMGTGRPVRVVQRFVLKPEAGRLP